ncbi:MAG: rhomboid family intramembrane serine protease [Pirellulales bacterium]
MSFQPNEFAGDASFPRPGEEEAPLTISPEMLATEDEPDTRIDFEQGMSCLPPVMLALIAAVVVVFVLELATGALDNTQALTAAGAMSRRLVLAGEVWRLVTAVFLHASAGHLVGNCVVLYIAGMACEHAFGWYRAALVFLVSGLCGSLLSMAFHTGPSVGASGAIFGLLGAVIVFVYKYQRFIVLRGRRVGFALLVWASYEIALGFFTPWIDNYAHIGGLLGGALAAWFLPPAILQQSHTNSQDDRSVCRGIIA